MAHRHSRLLTCVAALLALPLAGVLAHEFWLELPRFRLAAGESAKVHRLVGENFRGEAWGGKAQKVRRLVRYGPAPADSTDLTPANAAATDTLASTLQFARPGTHLVVLASHNSFIELPAEQFAAYLHEEGLDYALQLRQERGEQARPGREAYRRAAKALVQVGSPNARPTAADTSYRRVLGWPLELVPEQNPYRLASGAALTVRVLRARRPVPGALVQVWQRQAPGQPSTHFTARANQNGRFLLHLSGPGPYLLATVDMSPAAPILHDRADWQSTWASLTFAGPVASRRRSGQKP
jgi:hypothetical protein